MSWTKCSTARTRPWPEFTDGGGSSLELRDPHADNFVPEAWAASDEAAALGWQDYTFTATAMTPRFTPNIFNFHELRLGLLDTGEVLIDDVSVVEDPAGTNRELMQNGSFNSGTTAWRLLGNHELSSVITDGGNNVLKIVALGATNYHPNGLETSLKFGGVLVPVVSGRTYKISFRAKWLRGSPQASLRALLQQGRQDGDPRPARDQRHARRPELDARGESRPDFQGGAPRAGHPERR